MSHQPDDIRRYVVLTEASTVSSDEVDVHDDIQIHMPEEDIIFEDISDIVFRLRSYGEPDEDPEYARGVEEGLALAASMLESLLERYSRGSGE